MAAHEPQHEIDQRTDEHAAGNQDPDFDGRVCLSTDLSLYHSYAGAVALVLASGRAGGSPSSHTSYIMMQAAFVVVDEHTRSNVHSRNEGQCPLYHIPSMLSLGPMNMVQ